MPVISTGPGPPCSATQSAGLNKCDEYEFFPDQESKWLTGSYDIDCLTATHDAMTSLSLIFLFAYGLGIPIGLAPAPTIPGGCPGARARASAHATIERLKLLTHREPCP